jgi:hypothetical protein
VERGNLAEINCGNLRTQPLRLLIGQFGFEIEKMRLPEFPQGIAEIGGKALFGWWTG